MPSPTDAMIAALDAFQPHPKKQDDEYRLNQITKDFESLPDKQRVVPAMFALMERCPAADLGSPGPLVFCIEKLATEDYEPQLWESVRRYTMYLNVWMVNRILNCESDPKRRQTMIALLRDTLKHPDAKYVAESVRGYLKRQGESDMQ